jgi:putative MATE family efflux protein
LQESQDILDLKNKRIGPLLAKLSIPTTIGMLANSLYNIVDTIFIGRGVGTLAIAGVGIVFPVQVFIIALSQLIGWGSGSVISRNLGKKDYEKAGLVAGNSFVSVAIIGLTASAVTLVFMNPILRLFGATENIFPYAREYLFVISFGFVYFPFMVSSNNVIRAEGNAKTSMLILLAATGSNIILDPIFIFVLNLGIKGAAYATIISQFIGVSYTLSYFLRRRSSIPLKKNHLKLKYPILKEIIGVGFASFVRHVSMSFLIILVNNSLRIYNGEIAIAVYSVANKVIGFITMPLLGVVKGVQPIIGYNYGAKNIKRVKGSLKISILTAAVYGLFFTTIFLIFPESVIRLFSRDTELISSAAFPLRMIVLLFPVVGPQVIGAGFFQSIGKVAPSIFLSMTRQIIYLIPLILLLPLLWGINGLWIAFPIAEFLAIITTVILLSRELKRMSRIELQ